MKPFLFILKLFNDIDQQAPVIWKMASLGYPVRVVFLDKNLNMDIQENPHLRFLASFPNCQINYYYALKEAWPRFSNKPLLKSSNPILVKLFRLFVKVMRIFVWTDRWIEKVLIKINPSIAMADTEVPLPGSFEASWFQALRNIGVKVLGLPHSPSVYNNFDRKDPLLKRPVREYRVVWPELYAFDHIILSTNHERDLWLSQKFGRPEKLIVMGSPRFCPEWLEVNDAIISESFEPAHEIKGKLKVVFFMPHFGSHVDTMGTLNAINVLAGLDFIYLVIKEQTRQGSGHLPTEMKLRLNKKNNVEVIESQKVMSTLDWIRRVFLTRRDFKIISSVPLIRWSDSTICYSSSIGIEVISRKKALINPTYLYKYSSSYDALKACLEVHSLEQMVEALRFCASDGSKIPYSDELFSETVVYGNQKKHDVLESFKNLILSFVPDNVTLSKAEAR